MQPDLNHELSFDEFDEARQPRAEVTDFEQVVEQAISRRGVLRGLVAVGTATFLTSMSMREGVAAATDRFGFDNIAAGTADDLVVPEGFNWHVVMQWGDEMFPGSVTFDDETRGTPESQALAVGDNNDGMAIFNRDGREVFVVNNEYVNRRVMFGNRESAQPETDEDVRKGMMAHGVTIAEIVETDGKWRILRDSPYNRRITPVTEFEITGPAAGHELMKTAADPDGTRSLGTWNNCGNGRTPWGTYLACEENFNGYFSADVEEYEPTPDQKRYGIDNTDWGYGWARIDERFDILKHPNEPHRAGYVVEIDPFDPASTPKKRTALGRFKHENAEVVVAASGQAVVYMGDDERGEFIYKFVSNGKVSLSGDNSSILEDGKLYVARFNDDQTGEWLELTPETTGLSSQAEICIRTRQAASAVGATTMDRPEWVASNPNRAEVLCALTNNKNRGIKTNAGGDPQPVGGPNPRPANQYGQIVRWVPENGDHTSTKFGWDLFVLAGNPGVFEDANRGSDNITTANMFNSPDGIIFDDRGLLWIQTDGKYSNEDEFAGMGNNQMLAGDTATGEIRRFLVGPKECEVTGMTWSADRRTMFVGIQHPGERGDSHWPNGGNSVPRSAVVAIRRDDGGLMS